MNKPQPHVHAELIKAWADGAEIEVLTLGNWEQVGNPAWLCHNKYRIKPSATHKIGNIYHFCDGTTQMLVCSSSFHVAMVSISGSLRGCRAADAAEVRDIFQITEKEFEDIVGRNPSNYTLIESND